MLAKWCPVVWRLCARMADACALAWGLVCGGGFEMQNAPDLLVGGILEYVFGGVLLSHTLSSAVPSALEGLASGFGMGPGVSPPLWPP